MRQYQRIYLFLFGAALITAVTHSQEDAAYVTIMPSGAEQHKALSDNLFLTCVAIAPSKDLISDLKWTGPDGELIPKEDRKYTEAVTSDRNMLFIKDIQDTDEGTYRCSAMYANARELSAEVKLSTFMDITWKDAPSVQHAIINTDAKIKCYVMADPTPVVDWQKDGLPYKLNDRCTYEQDGIMCRPITEQDEGQYICRARVTSTGRMAERPIKVEVDIPPQIASLEASYQSIEEELITMTCEATGKPIPTITWVDKNNADLSRRSGYLVDEKAGQLTIDKVSREDQGEFTCLVKNNAGEDRRGTILHVVSKPKIKEFKNITAAKNEEGKLVCRVFADPPPDIIIQKLGSQRVFDTSQQLYDDRISISLIQDGDDRVFTLIINNIHEEDDGLYACNARNTGGTVSANGHLTVEFLPVFDLTPHASMKSWHRHAVNLTCIARSIPNASIEWYSSNKDLKNDPHILQIGDGPVSILQVLTVDMSFYSEYRCRATNKLGTNEYPIRIEEAFPPGEVMQANFETVTATTITFHIVPPIQTGGLPLTGFVVEYVEEGGEIRSRVWPIDSAFIVEKLMPEKRYSFKFAAMNIAGTGPFSQHKERIMPKKSAPQEPTIIEQFIVSPYSDRIGVRWSTPEDNGEPIDHYEINYYPAMNPPQMQTILEHDISKNNVMLSNLMPNTIYKIEVRAHNVIGYSMPGERSVRTAVGSVSDQQQLQPASIISTAVIIAIVVAVIIIIIIIVDVSCYFVNNCGILNCLCVHVCGRGNDGKGKEGVLEEGKGKDSKSKKGDDSTYSTGQEDSKDFKEPAEDTPMINGDKEKEALKDSMENDVRNKSPHGSKSSIAKDSPV